MSQDNELRQVITPVRDCAVTLGNVYDATLNVVLDNEERRTKLSADSTHRMSISLLSRSRLKIVKDGR